MVAASLQLDAILDDTLAEHAWGHKLLESIDHGIEHALPDVVVGRVDVDEGGTNVVVGKADDVVGRTGVVVCNSNVVVCKADDVVGRAAVVDG